MSNDIDTVQPTIPASAPTDLDALLRLVAELQERNRTLEERISKLEGTSASAPKRDRGPASAREMTEEDAWRIRYGDLKDLKHKAAAEALGLSYGQVYSCRGGYTFTKVDTAWKSRQAQPQQAQPQS